MIDHTPVSLSADRKDLQELSTRFQDEASRKEHGRHCALKSSNRKDAAARATEQARRSLKRSRRRGGWIPFGNSDESRYQRLTMITTPVGASGPTPDTAFWMAEPDGDLPLDEPLPWETRTDA